ncbi:long-chain-fatty-acid--CoA ligase [Cohnella nanjingensis]|uniref:Long-chain fatty acid--CoA ligase n=1 Tax=Cohnella nanjingensis TaxID=1387779 RepID=A0A7X0VHT2_9BACL|nr:long-chain fatty acid--CoA ligase [Cohnella nanjingensis]MBB6674470.1 long-chain fatty acid--CoA ligase [Cohnella nanjingensis]
MNDNAGGRGSGKIWLRHYPKEVPETLRYPDGNAAQFLTDAAGKFPGGEAMEFLGRSYSYAELAKRAARLANALRGLGIEKGDRVAILLPNCPQAVVAYYGILMAGAVAVQTNPLYRERELRHQLADSGAKAVIALDLLVPRVEAVRGETAIRHLIVTSLSDGLPFPKNRLYPLKRRREHPGLKIGYGANGTVRWSALLRRAPDTPLCEPADAGTDLALIQYTGGTTGVAKGVMLTHANIIANTMQTTAWFYSTKEGQERYLAALPLFHVFGLTVLMNQSVYLGSSLLLIPRFEPKAVLETIRRKRPTVFPGAPTMYIALLNHPDAREGDLRSIRVCVSGAAPLPREVQDRFEQLSGGRLNEGYGLTEASPVTHCNPLWGFRKPGTIGIPLPDTDARIVGEDLFVELPPGEIGEVAVRGPQVMKGYWGRPEETDKVLQDGWLRTGDIGWMDEDGFFTIIDRKKDVILAGGFNVYPREVEEVLFEHPAIREAAVVGVPDDYRGETVKAFIVLREGWQVSEMQLNRWCRDRLAPFKVPHRYEFREALPTSLIGKVVRRELRESGPQATGDGADDRAENSKKD